MRTSHGIRWERELRKELSKYGVVLRVAGSGVSEDAFCDLVFFQKRKGLSLAYAIECKATTKDTYYASKRDKEQFAKLTGACADTSAVPLIALKFVQRKGRKRKVVFIKPGDLKRLFPVHYDDFEPCDLFGSGGEGG